MAFVSGTLTGANWYPTGFTKVGGRASISSPWDTNFIGLGVTQVPLTGDFYNTVARGNVDHWELRTYDTDLDTFVVSHTGGAISSSATTLTIPSWVSSRPRYVEFAFYAADNSRMGGGSVVFYDKTNDWPAGWEGLGGRIGVPFGRTEIDDAANPEARWAEIDADLTFRDAVVTPAYQALDPEGAARCPRAYVVFRNYSGSPAELDGIKRTAAHWAGQGVYLGPDNERNGTPEAQDAAREILRCRAIWEGDPSAIVVIGDGVTFNRWGLPRLQSFLTTVKAGLTSAEWSKVILAFHDYNTHYDDVVTGDVLWDEFKAMANTLGIAIWADTEMNAFEAAHAGAGNLLHQLAQASTSMLINCGKGLWRERQFLYYAVQRGQGDHYSFYLNTAGQPFPLAAWLVQLEQNTRRIVSMERLPAGDDAPSVLAVRFLRANGSGTIVAKACGRRGASVRFAVTGAASIDVLSWEGEKVTYAVSNGGFDVSIGTLPSHVLIPVGAQVDLAPTQRDPVQNGRWFSSKPGAGYDRPPVGLDQMRSYLAYSDVNGPNGGYNYEWHTRDPFTPGDNFGMLYSPLAPIEFSAVEIHLPSPRHKMPTIKKAKLELRGLDGVWRAATKGGQPVVIDEPYLVKIEESTQQDGVSGHFFNYSPYPHIWVLQCDPTPATGWRLVIGNPGDAVDEVLTAGEAPTFAAWLAGDPAVKGPSEDMAYVNDYAGFGTLQPRLHLRGVQAYGRRYFAQRPLVAP